MQHGFFARDLRGVARALGGFHLLPAQHRIRVIDARHGLMQAAAIFGGQTVEQVAVGSHGVEEGDAGAGIGGERIDIALIGGARCIDRGVVRGVGR